MEAQWFGLTVPLALGAATRPSLATVPVGRRETESVPSDDRRAMERLRR